ncbi:Inhibitory regulator protein BUD2/CLA2 [Cytospora mali]|uniref:Inhibitory regulator protein BUD2/CLA2 n=1 Tax=Cytospora mali TaxID=578113 RepID=A0A194VGJ4_CYTMA|nr:Inhibitory regulator protein BUD2/CLA2 [Valsa mali var. pyri (nom. inval.)]
MPVENLPTVLHVHLQGQGGPPPHSLACPFNELSTRPLLQDKEEVRYQVRFRTYFLTSLPASLLLCRGVARRTSAGNLRSTTSRSANPTTAQATIRAVTPESTEHGAQEATGSNNNTPGAIVSSSVNRGFGSTSPQNSSPRSIPTVPGSAMSSASSSARRQGVVFNDYFPSSADSNSSSPPTKPSSARPRGHTMDSPYRQPPAATPPAETTRHRMGSVSSSGSLGSMPSYEDALRGPQIPRHSPVLESAGYPAVYPSRPTDLHIQTSGTTKDKKGSTRAKLMKRVSRPTSPLISHPPSLDSLPLPIPTDDANKILLLMKTLCGRMRGDVAYQTEANGPWYTGVCYIEEDRGSLMFDSGENGPFHTAVISDLRGCRVLPVDKPGMDRSCLEVVNSHSGVNVLLWPQAAEELDLWLAALLCWQQVRPSSIRLSSQTTTPTSQTRPELTRRGSSTPSASGTIIKVSRVALWDKGAAHSPRAITKRASTRDLRAPQTGWRKVSCILSDNGELKLITEHDVTVLCVISLSQLSRCAIQQLDKSVLDEEFCLAIFPIYASTSTQLSIFRPVYISLDHRVLFEVWFVLLRAFTSPEIYAIDRENEDQVLEITDYDADHQFEMFRVEKTINLRVIEAKVGGPTSPHTATRDRHNKPEQDPLVGNYFAEVMLDGDVRARTITKTETRNPFWRDDCEFADLPANLPYLSVILKRIDGNLEGMGHQLHTSLPFPKTGNLVEVTCGSVDIPLQQLERGKDHEQWLQICDDRQQSIGTMLCKIRHEEVVVFMAKDYQPLSEMLHKFSSGLTSQICEAIPGQLRRLAKTFLNIFQVSNNTSEWLMALVEDEIDGIGQQAQMKKLRFSRRLRSSEALDVSNAHEREAIRDMGKSLAGEANLLFRGNSLLTQALESHMRRLGTEYIDEILGDKIFEINEINPNCEVDPGKLQSGEDLNQHWERLMQFTNEIWDCIANSANKFPPELRHILKYIRAVAEDRYGDFLRTVAFTSVSGFLFLRFICPAILNPKLFGLLRDYPRPRAQRTLTLIAKALQALANLSNIGKKEIWMEPMNRFLTTRRQGLKDFIDNVCAIPAERSSCILPASYSTPITILGRLSPLAREGFPSLPYLVDHARSFASLVRLWVDHQPQGGVAESRYEGDLLKFHRYCVSLQKRADLCMARIDSVRSGDNENASQPTDSDSLLVEAMDHVTFAEAINTIPHKSSSNAWMDQERPPGSSGASSLDDDRTPALRSHKSSDKWASGLRQAVSGEPLDRKHTHHHAHHHNSIKSLRSGKNAKKFLSSFLRKMDRTGSPEASSSGGSPSH